MGYELPALPYSYNALEPFITAKTLEFHHDKHHATYVTNFNNLVKDTAMASMSIEEVIKTTYQDASKVGIFNNAAQAWNHTFYWECMKGGGGGQPSGALADKINADLGGYDQFRQDFKTAATTQFGSGWAWLVLENGKLKITKTGNADTPIALGQTPLLTCDVWEHAYYLDYQNKRPDYVDTFLDKLVNWDFVAANLAKA